MVKTLSGTKTVVRYEVQKGRKIYHYETKKVNGKSTTRLLKVEVVK